MGTNGKKITGYSWIMKRLANNDDSCCCGGGGDGGDGT